MARIKIPVIALCLGLVVLATACGSRAGVTVARNGAPGAAPETENKPDISAKPAPTKVKVTLYFGDRQAMYLLPEEREVAKTDEPLEAVIINELIKGPQQSDLVRTIPEGTRLLSVSVEEGIAYVNFSKEFKSKHWGGSAGESMTIYSVVNSLAKLPGIEKVQFLLEGKKEESILGHADTSRPIAPNWNLVGRAPVKQATPPG